MAAQIEAPSYDERLLIVGANGSGKSSLVRPMIACYPRWTIIDPKHGFEPLPDPKEGKNWSVIHEPMSRHWNDDRVLYRPSPEHMDSNSSALLLRRIFVQALRDQGKPEKARILYVDEGRFGMKANTHYWHWITNIAVTTRSFHTLGFWYASQRVAGIPLEVRTEAWRTYVFFLKSIRDRKEIVDLADDAIDEEELRHSTEDYHFLEIRRSSGGRVHVCKYPPVAAELAMPA